LSVFQETLQLMIKNINYLVALALTISISFSACVPPDYGKTQYDGIKIDLKDPKLQFLYGLQERQSTDSIITYFRNANPTFRYVAALTFGSFRDPRAIDSLTRLLKDPIPEVRLAAAFSLGQIGDPRAETPLLTAIEQYDSSGKYDRMNAAIMEAIGKCGNMRNLDNLTNIQTFRLKDTTLLEGQAFGIYRYGIRDSFNTNSINKMISLLGTEQPQRVRWIAANYLGRIKTKYESDQATKIIQIATTEKDNYVRMAMIKAMSKIANTSLIEAPIESIYRLETDYRVKCNIVNVLNSLDREKTTFAEPIVHQALLDKNNLVSLTAAQYYLHKGKESAAENYWKFARDSTKNHNIKYTMYGAALKWLSTTPRMRDSLLQEVQTLATRATSPNEKAEIMHAIGCHGYNYKDLLAEALKKDNPAVVRTAAAESLAELLTNSEFNHIFGGEIGKIRQEIKAMMFQLMRSGDAGLVSIGVNALTNPSADIDKKTLKSYADAFLDVMKTLKIPQEIEAYEDLRKAANFVMDSATFAPKLKMKIPIRATDWRTIGGVSRLTRASIKTNKGTIKIEFYPDIAHQSVANFITLSKSGFFNNKPFHRVVPNFVIQTGCPRGDGYGNLDYTLRTELSPMHYMGEGYLGMASAGPHTECSQWFITHSPTPHLDPNYTIFGKVVEGIGVVQQIEPGDLVENILIN
jgi:cyclophilin family peptidyl-prolyl cis-trans isomerase/HEAT repeat protein